MNTRTKLVRSLFFLACFLAAPGALSATPEVEARFRRGVELYNEADFRSALVEFKRAYEKSRNHRILYNVAQCEYQVTDYVAALTTFERYLKEGGTAIDKARREEVEQELPRIRTRIASIKVATDIAGASVIVDDEPRGTTPLAEPVLLNAGTHKITLRKEGYVDGARTIEVAGGDASTVELNIRPRADLTALSAPAETTPPPVTSEQRSSGLSTPAIVAGSAALVFAGATAFFAIQANDASDDLADAKRQPDQPASRLSDLDGDVGRWALLTDVSLGAAIVSAGVAVYFVLTRSAGSPPAGERGLPARTSTPKRARVSGLVPSSRGLFLGGSF